MPPTITFDCKKGTIPINVKLNDLFSKFLRQQMAISKFSLDTFWENTKCVCACGGRVSSFRSLWIWKRAQKLGGCHSQRHDIRDLKIMLNKVVTSKLWLVVIEERVGGVGGAVSFPPITFDYLKGPWLFELLIEKAVFEVSTTKNGHFNIYVRYIWGNTRLWGIHPPITLSLEKSSWTS